VKFVLAQFVDIHGTAKTKAVPASHFEDILDPGAGFAGFAVWGCSPAPTSWQWAIHQRSRWCHGCLVLPTWSALGIHGQPYDYDTRFVLLSRLNGLGERVGRFTGLEPEFSLLHKDEGVIHPYDGSDTLDKPCYDYKGLSRSRAYIEKLVATASCWL